MIDVARITRPLTTDVMPKGFWLFSGTLVGDMLPPS
jgi:hypothetical protein